ncbi:hypothetical protein J2752_000310 [Halarchaeum rubridurum]|uniref:Uncharacterized protein n=1 Tax=Halarchaeum rubridurum TaxID=489911 RepID=A0A830FVG6_9EURY|nr:hypothetical protein [Halarchaeum rubridurum]MBP1953429.1 hypothetical protein [Halarchaeum rubridurum]GGM65333.1 hypothetical protein GCM10009017_14290 [Halarchaeum rubridurum]
MEPVTVAVPRKGRPLEAVLDRLAGHPDAQRVVDDVTETLRREKAVTKGNATAAAGVYERLAEYSDPADPYRPDYTLLRDDREGKPRRIVFDTLTLDVAGVPVRLVGREEPFRALRKHEFALGFDSADLVLEEVVGLRGEPLATIADVNERIDPQDTDVRVVTGIGDTVYHTLMGDADAFDTDAFDRAFLDAYEGPLCISPRYERLVEAVVGLEALDGVEFVYPEEGVEEEAAIAETGLGVYLTVTGSTAREHGLTLGERLFPSETVLMENASEVSELAADGEAEALERVREAVAEGVDTELPVA